MPLRDEDEDDCAKLALVTKSVKTNGVNEELT